MEVLQVANGYLTFAISTGPLCLLQTKYVYAGSGMSIFLSRLRLRLRCLASSGRLQSRRSGYFHTRRIQGEEPEGARRPAGNRRSQDILFLGPDFGQISQSFLAKSLRNSGRARNNDSFLVSTPSNVEVAARKLRLQLALCRVIVTAMSRDKPVAT